MHIGSSDQQSSVNSKVGRWRRWDGILLLICALVLICGVLEGALRVKELLMDTTIGTNPQRAVDMGVKDGNPLHVRSPNRWLVYELRPNADLYVEHLKQRITTNSAGFRDREFMSPKPYGVYRIIVVGDSVTFGWYQAMDRTYPKLVEASFRQTGGRIEVFNMGVGGYNAIQEVEVVKTKALDYEPDLLVVGYVHNDNEWGVDGGLWHHFSRSGLYLYDLLRPRLMRLERRFTETITTEAF